MRQLFIIGVICLSVGLAIGSQLLGNKEVIVETVLAPDYSDSLYLQMTRGDANNDKVLDAADINMIGKVIMVLYTADVNGDKVVDANDVRALINKVYYDKQSPTVDTTKKDKL